MFTLTDFNLPHLELQIEQANGSSGPYPIYKTLPGQSSSFDESVTRPTNPHLHLKIILLTGR